MFLELKRSPLGVLSFINNQLVVSIPFSPDSEIESDRQGLSSEEAASRVECSRVTLFYNKWECCCLYLT